MCIRKRPIFENKSFLMYIEQINTKRFNFLFYLPIPVLFLGLMGVNYFSTQDVNVEDTLKLFIDQFGVNFTFVILIVLYVYVKCSKNNLQESRRHRFNRQISNNPIILRIQRTFSNIKNNSTPNSITKTENEMKTREEEQPLKI